MKSPNILPSGVDRLINCFKYIFKAGICCSLVSSAVAQETFSSPLTINVGVSSAVAVPVMVSSNIVRLTDITVTLNGLTAATPFNVSLVLEGPTGANAALLSGAGTLAAVGVGLTFSDDAGAEVPQIGAIATGTYLPTVYGAQVDLNALLPLAPTPPYGTNLAVFDGTNPNGTWTLFVGNSDSLNVAAFAGGYSITINGLYGGALLEDPPIPVTADFLVQGVVNTGIGVGGNVINSLTFENGSSLGITNELAVTSGGLTVEGGVAILLANNPTAILTTPGDLNLAGPGTLVANVDLGVAGDANVNGAGLLINALANIAGDLNVNPLASVAITGILNAANLNMNGEDLLIQGAANIAGAINLLASNTDITGNVAANALTMTGETLDISGVADIAGAVNLLGGDTTVTGTLNAGALVMDATNLFIQGEANINTGVNLLNGNTIVDGILNAGAGVSVDTGALLGGSGLINGNVLNNGVLAPGGVGATGALTINGNLNQGPSSTLAIDVNGGAADAVVVTGDVAVDGTLQVNGGSGGGGNAGGMDYGDQIPIIQAGGTISGDFDNIDLPDPSTIRGRFIIDDGTGILVIAPTSYTLVAETTNQKNVARALDSYIPARGNDREVVSTALDLLRTEQYPAAFDAIAPTLYESLPNITLEQANARNQMLAQRTNALRLGSRGLSLVGMEMSALAYDRDGKGVMDSKGTKDVISVAPENHWGVWLQGNGIFARVTNVSQVPNYHFDSGGFLGGLDYRWNEHFATGLYAGYQGTYAKYNDGSRTTVNSALFGGYATYQNGGFYADGIVGGSYDGYNVRRSIQFGTVDRTASSQPNGGQVSTYLGGGYDWKAGGFTFGPIISGQYTYVGVAPVTESGADSLDLQMNQQNLNSIRTNIGGHIAYTWNLTQSVKIIPEVRMTWQHEYLNNAHNIRTSLDGGAGPGFDYATTAPARDSVFAGAGFTAQIGRQWNTYAFYNADFGRQDFVAHIVSLGVNFNF